MKKFLIWFKKALYFRDKKGWSGGGLKFDWNTLDKDVRYFGPEHYYYDGDFWSFGFWYFHIVIHDNDFINIARAEKDFKEYQQALTELIKETDPALVLTSPNKLIRKIAEQIYGENK